MQIKIYLHKDKKGGMFASRNNKERKSQTNKIIELCLNHLLNGQEVSPDL